MTQLQINNNDWLVQKMCTDIEDYELSVEKQKTNWECKQTRESWRWIVSYHGSVVASGSVNSADEAKEKALASVPMPPEAIDEEDCGCD
ncbi:MAG: hypothetical protein GC137_09735 [Alphaproteobacteria bacterium]|nr:hypothetical protein [Alphaproteobacteria bacterium]